MKKILSLALAAAMMVSAIPAAYAAENEADYTAGTQVVFEAAGSESYAITVPALLNPGQSGTVTLSGTWANNRIVTVTADLTVTLTNSILEADQKVLAIDFTDDEGVYGISEKGSNVSSQTFTHDISVANITDALFGTWSGKFNYNVEVADVSLEPGWYNANNELMVSWDDLVDVYGLNVENDYGPYSYRVNDSMLSNIPSKIMQNIDDFDYTNSTLIIGDVSRIGNYALHKCYATTLILPSGLTSLGEYAICDSNYLVNLYIPGSVTAINNHAVYWNLDLENVTIGDGVTSIGSSAFDSCMALTDVKIPSSVTNISEYAFYNCKSLTTINFSGTMEQWNSISLAEDWNYDVPAIEIICSDGTVALE